MQKFGVRQRFSTVGINFASETNKNSSCFFSGLCRIKNPPSDNQPYQVETELQTVQYPLNNYFLAVNSLLSALVKGHAMLYVQISK